MMPGLAFHMVHVTTSMTDYYSLAGYYKVNS